MIYKPIYVRAIRLLGILTLFYCMIMTSALSSIIESEGWNMYGVIWSCIAVCYGVFGAYLVLSRRVSIVVCITMVLLIQAVTAGSNYLAALYTMDDVMFVKAVVYTIAIFLDLVLLSLYLMGFRRSSRRLMMLLGVQAYLMLLELMVAIHYSREVVNTIFMNFQTLYGMIVYILLVFLLSHRSVSDQSIKRRSRYNSESLYTSLGCGSIITISEEDYTMLSSGDRSAWKPSMDPEVEAEVTIPAFDRYGKYGIIVQKPHGSDNVRMVFHDATSIGYLNTIIVDVSHITEMESAYGCKKVRFYGKEGMFIDLLVGDFDVAMRSSQSF